MSLPLILAQVADAHNLSPEKLLSKSRERRIVYARNEAIQRMRRELPYYTLQDIADVFGMHHTSVMYALGRVKREDTRTFGAAARWMNVS